MMARVVHKNEKIERAHPLLGKKTTTSSSLSATCYRCGTMNLTHGLVLNRGKSFISDSSLWCRTKVARAWGYLELE